MTAPQDWAERGRDLGASLDACHAVVIVGEDHVAAAEVALGIARFQSPRRRVAVADLIGEVGPLQSLVTSEDPHGIVDSFEFGVSLNRIAHAVADAGQLFIMPSGTSPIDHDVLLSNPRWRRLAGGFRAEGALLLLVAPADAPRLKDLVDATDGLVIVGDAVPADIPVAQSLAWLRTRKTARPSIAGPGPLAMIEETRTRPRERNRRLAAAAGLLLTMAIAALVLWFANRPISRSEAPARAVSRPTPSAPATAEMLAADTAPVAVPRVDSAPSGPAGVLPGALLVTNIADSAQASRWSVIVGQTSTYAGAILDLRGRFETAPAGTYGYDSRTHVFSLVAGAFAARASAESLLVQLRARKVVASSGGTITSLPFAFLVQADVPAADVPERLKKFSARGQPVYALRQPNGAAHLYFGAYESARAAMLAESSVREAGFTPALAYRIGRVF